MEGLARPHSEVPPGDRASLYLESIRRYWWLLVAAMLVTASLTYVISSMKPKLYEGTAKVLLTNSEPINVLLHSTPSPSNDPERDLNTEVALVKLDTVAARVRRELRLPLTTTKLLSEVTVAPQGTSDLLAISARDRSPARAAAVASAFARHYVSSRRQLARSSYESAAALAEGQLAQLTPAERRGIRATDLRVQLRQLATAGALQTGGAQVVAAAGVPTTPVSPRPKFAAAIGGFVGLLIGVAAAIGTGAAERRRSAAARPENVVPTNGHNSDDRGVVSRVLGATSNAARSGPARREEAARAGRDD
jgi:uncharacterized protein involved in exopolysaccharide biosynthesis